MAMATRVKIEVIYKDAIYGMVGCRVSLRKPVFGTSEAGRV